MSKKRDLKHNINSVCHALLAECLAAYFTVGKDDVAQIDTLLASIVRLQEDYVSRLGHVEPGVPAKQYYSLLVEDFNKEVSEIIDTLAALA